MCALRHGYRDGLQSKRGSQRADIAGFEFQGPQMAAPRAAEMPQGDQRVAPVGARETQARILFQQDVCVAQRLGRPIQPLQTQRQRIASADIFGRKLDGALEQPQCVRKLSLLFQAGGCHVQQKRVLEALRQRLVGNCPRPLEIPLLREGQDFAEHGLV